MGVSYVVGLMLGMIEMMMMNKTDEERLAGIRKVLREWNKILVKNGYTGGLSNGWYDDINKEANG